MLEKTTALVCAVLGASLSIARADTDPTESGATPPSAAPAGDNPDRLTLPKGRAVLDGYLGFSLSDQLVGKPITLSPDIYYGVSNELTVGLVHSGAGTTGFIGALGNEEGGAALCLTGSDNGCLRGAYSNVGLEGRYKLGFGASPNFSLAVNGGLYIFDFNDPFLFDIKVGAIGRWHKDKLAVEFAPNIFIALTNRTADDINGASVTVSHDFLNIPITGLYNVAPKIDVALQLGLVLPFEDAGSLYQIPLSIGAHYAVNESLTATAAFTLTAIAGGDSVPNGADGRSLVLGGTYAF